MKYFLRNSQENTSYCSMNLAQALSPVSAVPLQKPAWIVSTAKKAYGVITTHDSNLKHYANDHEGIVIGAMLYDRHEMRPLFTWKSVAPAALLPLKSPVKLVCLKI
jgi:DNA mismatch repair protein MutS2